MSSLVKIRATTTNRFLTPDTIVPETTNPQSWNRYSYVHNNPINYNDPTGHCIGGTSLLECMKKALAEYGSRFADGVEDATRPITTLPFKINALDPLADDLIDHYAYNDGATYTLSEEEMIATNAQVTLQHSSRGPDGFIPNNDLNQVVSRLVANGGGTQNISTKTWGGALTNGTLGNFEVLFDGGISVTVMENGEVFWELDGTMTFQDGWDFNEAEHRSGSAEFKTWVGSFLPGDSFPINSVSLPVYQNSNMLTASWANSNPQSVNDVASLAIGDYNRIENIR